jgi:Carbohydrate-selective porin, OprB family
LGKKDNLGGVIVGMQPKLTSTSAPLSGLPRRDPDTGFHLEGFYQYQINENISITPGVIWLTAPNHNNQNGDILLGVLRTTFKF